MPEPEALTVSDAATRYLGAVCPVNEAWDALDLEVDRVSLGNERGDSVTLDGFHAALDTVASASAQAEATLADDSVAWPSGATDAIARVRTSLRADVDQVEVARELAASAIPEYAWVGAQEHADDSAAVRAALDLPEDPLAACELRE